MAKKTKGNPQRKQSGAIQASRPPARQTIIDRIIQFAAAHPAATGTATLLAGMTAVAVSPELGPGAGPLMGGGLAFTLAALRRRISSKQSQLIESLEERLMALESRTMLVEPEPVIYASFADSLIGCLIEMAAEEESKIELFAAVLAGSLSTQRPDSLDVKALLASLTDLTANEIGLARAVKMAYEESIKGAVISDIKRPDWGPDTDYHLNRLVASGLIDSVKAPYPAQAAGFFLLGPTPTLDRLFDLVSAGGDVAFDDDQRPRR